jgi:HEAT repeat protein
MRRIWSDDRKLGVRLDVRKQVPPGLFILCAIMMFASIGHAQKLTLSSAQVPELIRQLDDSDWKNRMDAFYRLIRLGHTDEMHGLTYALPSELTNLLKTVPEQSDEIKLALIKLLERENSFSKAHVKEYQRTGIPLGEGYGEYYGDLIGAVTSLKDMSSLSALLDSITTGNMVTSTLAELGAAALDPVIEKLNSDNLHVRQAATIVLTQMLELQKVSDPASRAKIKRAFIKAASDEDPYVRMSALDGFAALGDKDVIPIVEKLAIEDPYEASAHGGEKGYYLVRKRAEEVLQRLKLGR